MAIDYAWEQFFKGVLTLAVGNGPVRERLAGAYTSSLMHVRPEDLPEPLRGDFREITEALTRVKPKGDEGGAAVSAAALDDLEVRRIVEKIVSTAGALAKHGPNA